MAQINGSARSRKKPVSVLFGVVMTAPLLFSANPAQADAWGSGTLQYEIVVRDAQGEVVAPALTSGVVIQNFTSANLRVVGDDYFEVLRSRQMHDLAGYSVVAPTDPSFDMASEASFSGGLAGNFKVDAMTSVGRSYANSVAGLSFSLLVPAGGSFTISGSSFAYAASVGYEYNGVAQGATTDVRLVLQPQFSSGVVFSDSANARSTEMSPGFVQDSSAHSFSQRFENIFAMATYVTLTASTSVALSNSVTAVPEPSTYFMMLCGLATLAVPKLRRRRVDRVEPLLR